MKKRDLCCTLLLEDKYKQIMQSKKFTIKEQSRLSYRALYFEAFNDYSMIIIIILFMISLCQNHLILFFVVHHVLLPFDALFFACLFVFGVFIHLVFNFLFLGFINCSCRGRGIQSIYCSYGVVNHWEKN